MSKLCPCGSQKTYTECCGPYLAYQQSAPTPEALMRSRYTAFKKQKLDYITKTQAGAAEGEAKTSSSINWLKLEILNSSIAADGQSGVVEFKAHYQYRGQKHELHEISQFSLVEGQWRYIDGEIIHECCAGHDH